MRATIKQIAERSGLSVPTVSRILSDKGDAHQETTRQRVLDAARDLGYRPNSSARAMRRGKFDNIALLQSATDSVRSLLPMGLLIGMQEAAAEHEMRLSVASLPDTRLTDPTYVPQMLREWSADGLLINYNADIPAGLVALIAEYAIPAVWINSLHMADCVFPDDEKAGYDAAIHLLELGHTKIAFVDFNGTGHYSAEARRSGYARAMQSAGRLPRLINGFLQNIGFNNVLSQVTALLGNDWPTAMIAYGPETMRPLLIGAMLVGKRVPQDLSLILFSTSEREALHLPIDTMILPEEQIGRQAVAMLMQKIAAPQSPIPPLPVAFEKRVGWTTASPQ